ncbi:Cytochrome c oxidase assembly protein cox15 [Entomophthora muscae]|uniref:Cytochrome c oxidase assembly protein cox15 n=1 Tax=Entomophthora muscae TaxID=34485 RepID=A0ACC2TSF5_9FUNG|nr:Cytochrome c oxidase assembly protein cox15 [Entomophthora muscae]
MLGLKQFISPSATTRLSRNAFTSGSLSSLKPFSISHLSKFLSKPKLGSKCFSSSALSLDASQRVPFRSLVSSCLRKSIDQSVFGIQNIKFQSSQASSGIEGSNKTDESKNSSEGIERCPPVVGYWMLAMGAMVFGIVVVGGLTRLTESGLSIVEWNLIKGIKPPTSEEEWEREFEKYKQFPEFKKLNSLMTLEEFKFIFFMEWLHRLWGRAIGVAFVVPAVYFFSRGRLTPKVAKRSLGLAGLIGFQGGLGWYMVKSGLDHQLMEDPSAVPRVSQYRLASHLGTAFLLYVGFMLTGFEILSDNKLKRSPQKGFLAPITDPRFRAFRGHAIGTTVLVFITALSGAFVAGLDAGLVYNTFPNMGDSLIPPKEELWSPLYSSNRKLIEDDKETPIGMWRNIFDNPTTVQFNHRILAMTTLSSIVALYFLSRRLRLPRNARIGTNVMAGAGLAQVSLGISTLIYLVPVPLAAAHQSGSLALLTSGLYLVHTLRRPLPLQAPEESTQPKK